jgi:flagellar hook protein FlgE
MMRSLYSAVSGLRNHQTRMDVVANNISNVNTVAFKSSRVIFQDIYSQTSRNASAANGTALGSIGGTNPIQIGLGVKLATIDVLHNPAATQRTDNPLDVAIEGEGFFTIRQGNNTYYTRAGNFYVDNTGNLVNSSGDAVMGGNGATQISGLTNYVNIAIDETGVISGIAKNDPNGNKVPLGTLAIATFVNPSGLEKMGNGLYAQSANSGAATYSQAGAQGAGKLNVGGLEMSNVDLAGEFTDMIVTQRGFQANSRVITVSDTLLEELINLKR